FYNIERRGHREGYKMRDVDGELLEDDGGRGCRRPRQSPGEEPGDGEEGGEGDEGKEWIWEGLPAELETALDIEDIHSRWKWHCPVCSFFLGISSFFSPFRSVILPLLSAAS